MTTSVGRSVVSERPHAVPGLGFWLVEGQKLKNGERRAERQHMARFVMRREHGDRGRRVRRRGAGSRGPRQAATTPSGSVRNVRNDGLLVRPWSRAAPVAWPGHGNHPGLPRSRRPTSQLPRPRAHRAPSPLGPTRHRTHPLFRSAGGLAGHPVLQGAITELMRIAWRTVGTIITRVWADTAAGIYAFAGLQRIGIDEISYKRSHKYLTVVVDHDSGRLLWAHPGRDRATVLAFFDALEASARFGALRSPMSAPTGPTGSPTSSAIDAPPRSAAPTRFTSSAGPPTPSMRFVARRGATPAAGVTPAITDGPTVDPPPSPPVQHKHFDAHATLCGRTRKTSPNPNA